MINIPYIKLSARKMRSHLIGNKYFKQFILDPATDTAIQAERFRVSRNFFDSNRNKYIGRRGFVICNGPSLKFSDLSMIKNEISIASNLIYLAFEETEWRPTYVTVIDDLVWRKIAGFSHEYFQSIIISDNLDPGWSQSVTYQFRNIGHAPYITSRLAFSEDMVIGAYGGSSVTYSNLQLARHLGLNPVYLLGCDHYYNQPKIIKEGVPVSHSTKNHFSDKYRAPGELVNPAPIENMTKSFEIAQAYCEANDFIIYNATRGGNLEVFPRVVFDELDFI